MKIIVVNDKTSKKLRYVSEAVIYAALEKHISCEPIDISDLTVDKSRLSSSEYIKEFSEHIREEKADVILCTGLNSLKIASGAKKQYGMSILVCGMISDYILSPTACYAEADCLFVPHKEIKAKLIKKGHDGSRIFVTGIPVKKNFREHIGKAAARNYLVIPKNRRVYLLIPDGLELRDIERLCEELAKTEKEDHILYVPTKRNSLIRDELIAFASGNRHISIITYTKQLNLYVESADAMLLKPDSLTSTEAAVSGVPIVHLSLNENKDDGWDFFASHEMAVIGRSICDTVKKAKCFCEKKAVAARVIQMQYRNICSDAADKMIEIIMDMTKRIEPAAINSISAG